MAPAQVMAGVKQEDIKPEIAVKVPVAEEDLTVGYMNNFEDIGFSVDGLLHQQPVLGKDGLLHQHPVPAEGGLLHQQPAPASVIELDVDVDVVGCTNTPGVNLAGADDPDGTEYSSSFNGTVSEDDLRISDGEVESHYREGGTSFNGFNGSPFQRKKKLHAQWRKSIRPMMWRCKWLELRLKEFQDQILKYDKELAANNQRKIELKHYTLQGSGVRSLPFYGQAYKNKTMKRRKRVRIEDKVDVPTYMSYHNLFSYFENQKFDVYGTRIDDCSFQVIAADEHNNGGFDSLGFNDDSNSFVQLLKKIIDVDSQVHRLKARMNEVFEKNSGLENMENMNLLMQSDLPSSASLGNDDAAPLGSLYYPLLDFDVDFAAPESVVSSSGDVTNHPDVLDTKMGILSIADLPFADVSMRNEAAVNGGIELGKLDDVPTHKLVKEERLEDYGAFPPAVLVLNDPSLETTRSERKPSLQHHLNDDVPTPSLKCHFNDVGPSHSKADTPKRFLSDDVPINVNKKRRMDRKPRLYPAMNLPIFVQRS